jgi:hypothetical protein
MWLCTRFQCATADSPVGPRAGCAAHHTAIANLADANVGGDFFPPRIRQWDRARDVRHTIRRLLTWRTPTWVGILTWRTPTWVGILTWRTPTWVGIFLTWRTPTWVGIFLYRRSQTERRIRRVEVGRPFRRYRRPAQCRTTGNRGAGGGKIVLNGRLIFRRHRYPTCGRHRSFGCGVK